MSSILIFLFLYILNISNAFNVDVSQTKVWGPGLKPHIYIMPARYFFIEPRNEYKVSLNVSIGDVFNVDIAGTSETGRPCRIWTNKLDSKEGMYIIRYKLYETCDQLKIEIKYKTEHIAESPYEFKNVIYSEDCDCPQSQIENWITSWECAYPKQIKNDLQQFKSVNWNLLRDKIVKQYDNPGGVSLCHYVIKNNVVFRRCYGKYVGFKMFMDNILLSITRKVVLPDVEFFVNLGDWPLVSESHKFPIFSWCGSTDKRDIIMPTYDICESTLENMGRVTLDMLSVQGNLKNIWDNRIPKLFWRGRDSNQERLKLITISKEHPNLINASLTNFFFYRDQIEKYGPKSEHVSFFDFFDYKYQMCIDGTVAAYRFPYLLAGGSLVFKQKSKYYEHFYKELEPETHYVEVERDLSNLVEKINWALQNEDRAKAIAAAGRKFALENLLPKNIFCYYVVLLHEFSKLIVSEIKVLPDMEQVEQIKSCKCKLDLKEEL